MEQRASIPPDLPYSYPTTSQWQDPPSDIAFTQTPLPSHASYLIIGSGITGASIAYHLLRRHDDAASEASVVMLDARGACSGASGRNGGHTKHGSYRAFLDNASVCGDQEAAKIARFEYRTMNDVHACARQEGIQCESWEGETVDVFYDKGHLLKAQNSVARMKEVLGRDDPAAGYTFHTAKEAGEKFLVNEPLGALTYEAGSISPYKFTTGLLKVCMSLGLSLQTHTPALSIQPPEVSTSASKNANGWMVTTPRGHITADKVVFATNGYSAHLLPSVQGIIVPLRGHMTAQRPGSSLPKPSLQHSYSFIYNDSYEYMVPRRTGSDHPGDIMIGGGSTKTADQGIKEFGTVDDTSVDPVIVSYLEGCTVSYFGNNWGADHPDGRMRRAWTGIMGYSADGFPLVGSVPGAQNLFIAASFQGLGMVLSFNCAKALVSIMKDEGEHKSWFPSVFEMNKSRLQHKFQGRLHAKAPKDLEAKAQL